MALYGFMTHSMDGVLVQAPCESGEMEHNDSHNCNDNGVCTHSSCHELWSNGKAATH